MRIFILIFVLIFPIIVSAATVSGEEPTRTTLTKTQYSTDKRGRCYIVAKNPKTKKEIQRYVAKKFCKK